MAIIPKQIGWSQEALLYWEVLKELDKLSGILSRVVVPSTVDGAILLENGDFLLQENGDFILF